MHVNKGLLTKSMYEAQILFLNLLNWLQSGNIPTCSEMETDMTAAVSLAHSDLAKKKVF